MIPNHGDSVSRATKTATKTHHPHPPWPGVEFSGTRCEVWTRRGAFASFLGCAGFQNHQSDVVLDQTPWYPLYPQIAGDKSDKFIPKFSSDSSGNFHGVLTIFNMTKARRHPGLHPLGELSMLELPALPLRSRGWWPGPTL